MAYILLMADLLFANRGSSPSSNIIYSLLEVVYVPQKYHCRPQILDLVFFIRQYCLAVVIAKNVFVYLIIKVGT